METRHEACSAEGQPRNILECNPNRFAARCLALSRQCHRVIHSCYAFWRVFGKFSLVMPGRKEPTAVFKREDPGIHQTSKQDGSPDQVRRWHWVRRSHRPRSLGRVNDPPTCRRILHRSGTGL